VGGKNSGPKIFVGQKKKYMNWNFPKIKKILKLNTLAK
jgi:hypothetical protein